MFGIGHIGRQGIAGRRSVSVEAPALDINFMTPGSLDSRITFTRASTAWYFNSSGTMQSVANDTPRWDYDPLTGLLNGLLVEQPATNILLNSAVLSTQTVTVAASVYVLSFYGSGSITMSDAFTFGPFNGTGPYPQRVWMAFTPTAGTLTLTVSGNVQNAQLETNAIPGSYVPTTGAPATRAVDSMTMPTSPWYTSAVSNTMTMAVEVLVPVGGGNFMQFDNGSSSNRILLGCNSGPFVLTNIIIEGSGGVTTYQATGLGKVPFAQPFKMAYSSGPSFHQGAISGVVAAPGNSATPLPPVTTLKLGRAVPVTIGVLYMRRARYWPRVMSALELQSITR